MLFGLAAGRTGQGRLRHICPTSLTLCPPEKYHRSNVAAQFGGTVRGQRAPRTRKRGLSAPPGRIIMQSCMRARGWAAFAALASLGLTFGGVADAQTPVVMKIATVNAGESPRNLAA